MKTVSKAIRQPEGDLLLKADTQALLHRALHDVVLRLKAEEADPQGPELRALQALQQALGEYPGELPTVAQLLGDPRRELLARNLLKLSAI